MIRLRPFWILLTAFLGLALLAGYYAATWPGFRVRAVSVRGNRVVARSEILRRAAISASQNIWLQNPGAIAARIQGIPYIARVRIQRKLPAQLLISVTERTPYALVGKTSPVLVDHELRVLEMHPVDAHATRFEVAAGTPSQGGFLRGAQVVALRKDYDALLAGHARVQTLRVNAVGELTAWTPSGIVIQLGEDEAIAQKARLIEPILSQAQGRGKTIRTLDLRAPKTPVVVYR